MNKQHVSISATLETLETIGVKLDGARALIGSLQQNYFMGPSLSEYNYREVMALMNVADDMLTQISKAHDDATDVLHIQYAGIMATLNAEKEGTHA